MVLFNKLNRKLLNHPLIFICLCLLSILNSTNRRNYNVVTTTYKTSSQNVQNQLLTWLFVISSKRSLMIPHPTPTSPRLWITLGNETEQFLNNYKWMKRNWQKLSSQFLRIISNMLAVCLQTTGNAIKNPSGLCTGNGTAHLYLTRVSCNRTVGAKPI